MKKISFLLILFVSSFSFAQQTTISGSQLSNQLNTITTAVPFLLITPDARAGGMGDAGCASAPDIWSNYWNASKNVFLKQDQGISLSYTPWLRALVPDINLLNLSAIAKIGEKNALGFTGRYFSLGNLSGSMGTIRPYEYAYSLSYSRLLSSNFSVGISARRIYSDLSGGNLTIAGVNYSPAKSISGDLSCYWKDTIRLKDKISEFAWGVNISNIGKKINYSNGALTGDFLPTNLRIGVSYKIDITPCNSMEIILDANKLLVPTPPVYETDSFGNPIMILNGYDPYRSVFNALYTSFYDAPGGFKEELHEIIIASGIEYWCYNVIAVRTGYFFEHETKGGRKYFTTGLGLRYHGIELDGSYLFPTEQRHPLQNTWRVSLAFEFDRFRKKKS
jgi:hypothetical protein